MKKIAIFVFLLTVSISLMSQDIVGTWNSLLVVPGGQLRVDWHITKTDDGYKATMDSPDQNAYDIPMTSIKYEDKEVTITADDLGILYKGTFDGENLISGTFTQMGQSFDLDLKRKVEEEE